MKRTLVTARRGVPVSLLLLLLSPLWAAACGDEDKCRLSYTFSPGQETRYKFEYNQEYEIKGSGYTIMIDMEYTERCLEVMGDSLYGMKATVDKVSVQIRRNDELIDTGLEDIMKGQSFLYRLSPRGVITYIEAEGFVEREKEVLMYMVMVLYGSYPYLPGGEVTVGEEWTFDGSTVGETRSDMEIESDSKFVAKRFKKEKGRRCLEIEGSGETYMSGRIKSEEGRFLIEGQGKERSRFYYDVQGGRVVKSTMESSNEATVIEASKGVGEKRESTTINVTYSLKKEIK